MTDVSAAHSPANGSFPRTAGNLLLNFLLLPVFAVIFLICLALAPTQIFPARTARNNFQARLSFSAAKSLFATAATLFHYVLVVIEDFVFWPAGLILVRDNASVRADVAHASGRAAEKSVGLVVLSAHFGNIEITAQCLNALLFAQISPSAPLIALAKPSRWPLATRLLGWYRGKRAIEILWTNRKDLVRTIITQLKNKRALALLVDQKPASAGCFISFFGTPAAFPDGGIEVALRTQSEFVFVTSRRLWPGCHTFEGRSLTMPAGKPHTTASILESYAQWLESVIALSPCQWCWDYRKWSRKPQPQELQ